VELAIKDTLDHFFDMDKSYFSAWARKEYSWEFSTGSEDNETTAPPFAAPLYFAAWRGFLGLVGCLLIKHPEQVHHLGGRSGTVLHASVQGGHIKVSQFLFAHGVDINSRSARNFTPLHIASEWGRLKIVKWLLNHSAAVNLKEADGHNSLHFSACYRHLEVYRMLLEHGAVVNTRSNTGSTPFLEASKSGRTDTIWLLLAHNPDVTSLGHSLFFSYHHHLLVLV
jgi:ankyrin repeat protein